MIYQSNWPSSKYPVWHKWLCSRRSIVRLPKGHIVAYVSRRHRLWRKSGFQIILLTYQRCRAAILVMVMSSFDALWLTARNLYMIGDLPWACLFSLVGGGELFQPLWLPRLFEWLVVIVAPHGVYDLYFRLAATWGGEPCGLNSCIVSFGTARWGILISDNTSMLGALFFYGNQKKLVRLLNHLDE